MLSDWSSYHGAGGGQGHAQLGSCFAAGRLDEPPQQSVDCAREQRLHGRRVCWRSAVASCHELPAECLHTAPMAWRMSVARCALERRRRPHARAILQRKIAVVTGSGAVCLNLWVWSVSMMLPTAKHRRSMCVSTALVSQNRWGPRPEVAVRMVAWFKLVQHINLASKRALDQDHIDLSEAGFFQIVWDSRSGVL